eukprot:UN18579
MGSMLTKSLFVYSCFWFYIILMDSSRDVQPLQETLDFDDILGPRSSTNFATIISQNRCFFPNYKVIDFITIPRT